MKVSRAMIYALGVLLCGCTSTPPRAVSESTAVVSGQGAAAQPPLPAEPVHKEPPPASLPAPLHYDVALATLAKELVAPLWEEGAPKRIAVYSFRVSNAKKPTPLGEFITSMLPVYLQEAAPHGVKLFERRKIALAIEEVAKGQSAVFDENTAVKVGKFVQAQALVTGDVFPSTRELVLAANLEDVQTAESLCSKRIRIARTEDLDGIVAGGQPPKVSELFRQEKDSKIDAAAIPAEKYVQLGDYLYDRGEDALAMEQYRKALAQAKTAKLLYRMGVIEYEANQDYRTALTYFEQAQKRAPKKANIHYAIALAYSQLGRVDVSVAACHAALSLNPAHYDARKLLGINLASKGKYDDAIREYDRAKLDAPRDPEVYYNEACAYSLKGDAKRALDLLDQAVRLGFHDYNHMLEDPDLASLRDDPRFQSLIRRMAP